MKRTGRMARKCCLVYSTMVIIPFPPAVAPVLLGWYRLFNGEQSRPDIKGV